MSLPGQYLPPPEPSGAGGAAPSGQPGAHQVGSSPAGPPGQAPGQGGAPQGQQSPYLSHPGPAGPHPGMAPGQPGAYGTHAPPTGMSTATKVVLIVVGVFVALTVLPILMALIFFFFAVRGSTAFLAPIEWVGEAALPRLEPLLAMLATAF